MTIGHQTVWWPIALSKKMILIVVTFWFMISATTPDCCRNEVANSNHVLNPMTQADTTNRPPATVFNLSEKDRERFHSKYKVGPDDQCWEWLGTKFSNGYGAFKANRKTLKSHRISYQLENGSIDEKLIVRHSCHNVGCVNPFHLCLGTHKDNMRDMVEAGRSATGDRHSSRLYPDKLLRGDDHPARKNPGYLKRGDDHWTHKKPELLKRGSDHGSSKLNEEKVLAIRAKFAAGGVSKAALGREYGVNECMIGFIIRREKWTHI